jgi:hypothetical protein
MSSYVWPCFAVHIRMTSAILGILGWLELMPTSAFGQTAPSTDRSLSRDDNCISLLNFQIPDSGMAITKVESVPTAPD